MFTSGSFPVAQEGRSCGHTLLSGTCLFSADREREGQSLLTRARWAGESAALAVGPASRGSAPTSFLLPVLPVRPGEDRQLGSSVFSASFWTACRRVRPPWDLWPGEGEPPRSSAPECSVMNRGGGHGGPVFSSPWALGG